MSESVIVKLRLSLKEGIPGELHPRTVPTQKKPNDAMEAASN